MFPQEKVLPNFEETFEVNRARLPDYLFYEVVKDMDKMASQYRKPSMPMSEDVQSRYATGVSLLLTSIRFFPCSAPNGHKL
jgi:hypothetical protein